MLFKTTIGNTRYVVDATLNCGRYVVSVTPEPLEEHKERLTREIEGYLRMFTDKPIEFSF